MVYEELKEKINNLEEALLSPKKSYYAIIPATVRYDKRLTPNAKLLYGEITALCEKEGYCWAKNSYFAELYNVNKSSISKWVSQLIEYKYIYSYIIYKENSKEILQRQLFITDDPYSKKDTGGIVKKKDTPIVKKRKDNTTSINTTINNIYTYWNSKNIYVHIKNTITIQKAIKKALSMYSEKEIKEAIDKYSKVYSEDKYFWTYKWTLLEFLTRKKGLAVFIECDIERYLDKKNSKNNKPLNQIEYYETKNDGTRYAFYTDGTRKIIHNPIKKDGDIKLDIDFNNICKKA